MYEEEEEKMYKEEEEEDWSLGARGHLGKPGLRAAAASSLPPQAALTAPHIKSLSYASSVSNLALSKTMR